jgi:hypothetical protein
MIYSCSAGYFCPTGSSSPTANACSLGTYTDSTSLVSQSQCTTCPARYMCSSVPRTTAQMAPCTVGYYCPAGSSVGTACPAGESLVNKSSVELAIYILQLPTLQLLYCVAMVVAFSVLVLQLRSIYCTPSTDAYNVVVNHFK